MYIAGVQFVKDGNYQGYWDVSPKTYHYCIKDESIIQNIFNTDRLLQDKAAFRIVNSNGYDYRKADVVFQFIRCCADDENVGEFTEIVSADFSKFYHLMTYTGSMSMSNVKLDNFKVAWHGITPEIYHKKETKDINNTPMCNDRKENNMFNSITKSMKFGFAEDVKMSIYGPAFRHKDGWQSYHDGKMIDVADLVFDDLKMFMMMPVAKDAVRVGDFILHNDNWVRVCSLKNSGLEVIKLYTNEIVTLAPSTNIFGFSFYTKLVSLIGNMDMSAAANEQNPFGNLPMLMLMANNEDSSMMETMLLMNMMGGKGFQSFGEMNPLMLMMLMKNENADKSNLLPLMLAFNNSGFSIGQTDAASMPIVEQ